MSKRELEFYLVDILIAYNKIKRYIHKFHNAQDFSCSELEWDATMRQLEIIGEATKHLINFNFLSEDKRIIVDFRNYINHEYFGIDEDIVWNVVNNLLDEYIADIKEAISKNDINIENAILHALKDNKLNIDVSNFLQILLQDIKRWGKHGFN